MLNIFLEENKYNVLLLKTFFSFDVCSKEVTCPFLNKAEKLEGSPFLGGFSSRRRCSGATAVFFKASKTGDYFDILKL